MYGERPDQSKKPICQSCHQENEPWKVYASRLLPFPDEDKNDRTHCTSFPHRRHLAMSDQPVETQCRECHRDRGTGPSHEQCIECHKDQPDSEARTHSFQDCEECHALRPQGSSRLCSSWLKSRSSRVGDNFQHSLHDLDVREEAPYPELSCAFCHPNVARHDGYREGERGIEILSSSAMSKTCDACHNRRVLNPRLTKERGKPQTLFATWEDTQCNRCHKAGRLTAAQIKKGHEK